MKEVQFIFNGGLGNQIFQYLASRYISEKFINFKINYALSEDMPIFEVLGVLEYMKSEVMADSE